MKTTALLVALMLSAMLHAQYYGMDSAQFNSSWKGLVLKPSDYNSNPSKRYPLIVTIGGNGEVGSKLSVLFNVGIPRRVKMGKPTYQVMGPGDTARFLYVCLLPDVSTRGGQPNFVNPAIDYMIANYRVDTTKIMVSGISQGGNDVIRYGLWTPTGDPNLGSFGGFDYRQQRVRFYVSGSPPLVGTPYSNYYSRFGTYNWGARFFHGALDGGVTTAAGSLTMNDTINKYHPGSSQRFLLAGYGHDNNVWDSMYSTNGVDSNINIYRWLVMSPSIVTEPVPVAIAGPPQVINSTSTQLDAAASYSPNGSITNYNWQQVSGPAASIQNANSPTPVISNLNPGDAYGFKLTVTDIAGASGSDITSVTVTNTILPVGITYFTAQQSGTVNVLQWGTASEQNSNYFSIERSGDATQYKAIGTVAAVGFSNAISQYSFKDLQPAPGIQYYRLRMVDKDGKYTYSKVVLVNTGNSVAITMFPNPAPGKVSLVINNQLTGNGSIHVYDINGRLVKQEMFIKQDKIFTSAIDMQSQRAGTYLVEIKMGDQFVVTRQLQKQ